MTIWLFHVAKASSTVSRFALGLVVGTSAILTSAWDILAPQARDETHRHVARTAVSQQPIAMTMIMAVTARVYSSVARGGRSGSNDGQEGEEKSQGNRSYSEHFGRADDEVGSSASESCRNMLIYILSLLLI